ncbi:redoxin family protein [Rhodobacterales bacterium HKCCE3408]|nr:redoxin family protein [Rhodobacterales bacterium HKCCE3408]
MIASGPAENRPPHIAFEVLSPMAHLSVRLLPVYLALALGANAAAAQGLADIPREGDMRGMLVHDAPQEVSQAPFTDMDGGTHTLSDFAGQVVLLNFWATWCAPCREEMPALDTLQQEMGSDAFRVVTLATGRNPPQAVRRFFEEEGIEALPTFLDPQQQVAREMAIFGLPITVLIDAEGREVARMRGDADWASPEAMAFIAAAIGQES